MLQALILSLVILTGVLATPKTVSAAIPGVGGLFKAPEFSAVYMMGGDGKRHVFPIEAVYKSWHGENWSMHRTISLPEVSSLMLGRNIVYKPGTLVKIPSVPKVYYVKEVSQDRDLAYIEWIPTEAEFNSRGFRVRDIKDLPEPFFPGHYVELPNNNPQVNAQAAQDGNDFDNDTIPDVIDNCPINANRDQADRDSDRVGDVCDSYDNRQANNNTPNNDYDNDGIYDTIDNCPTVYNREQTDTDSDRVGDACDYYNNRQQVVNNDFDNDTIPDAIDNCPLVSNTNQADADSDRVGDVCDSYNNRQQVVNNDFDNDTIPDYIDNCPINSNTSQADADSDRVGDACDGYDNRQQTISNDFDHDGIPDAVDNCPITANQSQTDVDSDRVGDACDNYDNRPVQQNPPSNDFDNDTIPDLIDNCPITANTNQADADSDRVGDVCDSYDNRQSIQPPADTDHDGIADTIDNCPINANTNQSDVDSDRVGDVCDSYDNRPTTPPPADFDHDGVADTIDNCPVIANTNQSDVDGDHIGDACDNHDDRVQPLVPPALALDPASCSISGGIKIKATSNYMMKLRFVYGIDGGTATQTVESALETNPTLPISGLTVLTHYRAKLTVIAQNGATYTTNDVVFKLYADNSNCRVIFFDGTGTNWSTTPIIIITPPPAPVVVPPALALDPASCSVPNAIKIKATANYKMKLRFVYGVDGSSATQSSEGVLESNPYLLINNLTLLTHYRGKLTVTAENGAVYTTNDVIFKIYADNGYCRVMFFDGSGTDWSTAAISAPANSSADSDGDGLDDYSEKYSYYTDRTMPIPTPTA